MRSSVCIGYANLFTALCRYVLNVSCLLLMKIVSCKNNYFIQTFTLSENVKFLWKSFPDSPKHSITTRRRASLPIKHPSMRGTLFILTTTGSLWIARGEQVPETTEETLSKSFQISIFWRNPNFSSCHISLTWTAICPKVKLGNFFRNPSPWIHSANVWRGSHICTHVKLNLYLTLTA